MFSVFARILFFASVLKLVYAQNGSIEIERRRVNNTNGNWAHQPDTFKIPSAMCSSDVSAYCGVMGGQSVGGCTCECNSENTTFGFYDDQWKCTANSKVRQHGGCSLILSNRTADSTLMAIPLKLEADISYVIPTDHQRCYIIPHNSTYLQCNGSWKILDNNFVFRRFSMAERHNKQLFTFNRTNKDFRYTEVKGRILRMKIGCYNKTNKIIPNCLLLKMEGTMRCPQFSLPTLPPIISPTSEKGTSGNKLQTHKTHTSLSSLQTTVETPSFVNKRKNNASGENDGDKTMLIIGVSVGVIGLTLIIVAIVIVLRRRRIKRNAVVSKSNKTVENVSYELGADNSFAFSDYGGQKSLDQDEYSYAYANAARRGNMSNAGPHNSQGPQISVLNHAYGKVKGLDSHGSPCQTSAATSASEMQYAPVYAEVDEPKRGVKNPSDSNGLSKRGANPQKSINSKKEPLYNVLEEPKSVNEPLEGRDAPLYHVLEGSFSEGAPVYNVLEEPPSNDNPVYRSLEDQTPRVYSSLNREGDSKKEAFKQPRSYNDTVYDAVGEVINDTSDVYQKLNQNDQGNKEMYQALNNADNALSLNLP